MKVDQTKAQKILRQLKLDTKIDIAFLEKIEEHLIKSGIHIELVARIMNILVKKAFSRKNITRENIIDILRNEIEKIVIDIVAPIDIEQDGTPQIILVCGINGCGKTTTIGKMAHMLNSLGWDIEIASCDTYRAAADEQLKIWTSVPNVDIVSAEKELESPYRIAVRAYHDACNKNKDILIIDTAGRSPENTNLMAELAKTKRKLSEVSSRLKVDNTVLIVDSNCGYTTRYQVEKFKKDIAIDGVVLTKADISQQAGSIVSLCMEMKLPLHAIANGEGKKDLHDIEVQDFVDMILSGL